MKLLRDHAKKTGQQCTEVEGANHTTVTIGGRATTIPRHSEINELTARGILRRMGVTQ